MKNNLLLLIFIIFSSKLSSQISDKIKKEIEKIDSIYFTTIYSNTHPESSFDEIEKIYETISQKATNDELFYLSLMGGPYIKRNAVQTLLFRKDIRIVKLYQYYSEFPFEYNERIGHVSSNQDLALSKIRGWVISRMQNYQFFKTLEEKEITNYFTKEDIIYYKNLDIDYYRNLLNEFQQIDKIYIPKRLDTCKAISDNWVDDKLIVQLEN